MHRENGNDAFIIPFLRCDANIYSYPTLTYLPLVTYHFVCRCMRRYEKEPFWPLGYRKLLNSEGVPPVGLGLPTGAIPFSR